MFLNTIYNLRIFTIKMIFKIIQVAATEEKTIIEEAQRERARGLGGKEWVPRYFRRSNSDDGIL